MNVGDSATTTTDKGRTVVVKLRARAGPRHWAVRRADGFEFVSPEEALRLLPEPPFAFRFMSERSDRNPPFVRRCLLCRDECERVFACDTCNQSWCSERCRDAACSAGHAALCAMRCATTLVSSPVSEDLRIVVRSFPTPSGSAKDAVRQICALGLFKHTAGVYFSTETGARRAGFINLQPLASLRVFQCNGDDVCGMQSTIRDGLHMALRCVAGILEMRICAPSIVLFAVHGGRMEMCYLQAPPTTRFIDHGIDRMKLDWRASTLDARVYDASSGEVGALLRFADPIVFDDPWRAEVEQEFAAETGASNVNLGATEWSPESCQLIDPDSAHAIDRRMQAAATEKEYMAATNNAVDALNMSLSLCFLQMLQMDNVDFFLFSCDAEHLLARSQRHAALDVDVVPVRMNAGTKHQRSFPEVYEKWLRLRSNLIENCGPGVVVVFEICRSRFDGRAKYFTTARHWGRDLLTPTMHEWSAIYERHVVQGKIDMCDACHTSSIRLLRCSHCKTTRYCSADCQRAHWPSHRTVCRVRRAGAITIQACARGRSARRASLRDRCARAAIVVQSTWRGARQRRRGLLASVLRASCPSVSDPKAAAAAMVLSFWRSKTEADAIRQGARDMERALRHLGLPPLRDLRRNPCDATHDMEREISVIRRDRWRNGAIHWSETEERLAAHAPLLVGVSPPNHPRPWMYSGEATKSQRRRTRQRRRLAATSTSAHNSPVVEPNVNATLHEPSDGGTCVICLDRPRTHGLLHDGSAWTMHLCVCAECAPPVGSPCPMCRQTIIRHVRVHD
jgi:hypothetical protein